MNKIKLSVRSALLWSFAERYTSLIVTLASTMILARILTPSQVGIFSLCAAAIAVAGILRDFGISEYLIQEKNLTKEKIRAAFSLAIIVAWSIGGAIFLSRGFIGDYYSEKGVSEVLGVLSLNFLFLPFASPAFALLNREMDFRKVYAVQTIGAVVSAVATVLLAYLGYGYMSLAWGNVINIVCQNVVLIVIRPRESWLMPGFREARAVLSYGSVFVSSRTIETFARNAHEFVIASQLGFVAVGLFSRAMGLIEMFYANFTSAVLRVTTPVFANDCRDSGDLALRYAVGTAMLTVFAWPFYGFIALMSSDIILVLFGDQWLDAAPIATVLALSIMPNYLVFMGPSLLAATGYVKVRLRLTLIYAPVHIFVIVVASNWGVVEMALAFCFSSIFSLVLYVHQLKRVLGCDAKYLFFNSGKSAVVGLLCIVAQYLIQCMCVTYSLTGLLALMVVVAVSVIVWLLAVGLVRHPVYSELRRYLKMG